MTNLIKTMTSLIKTDIILETTKGAFPIFYCNITEKYYIRPVYRLIEVEHKRVCENGRMLWKWIQTGERFPIGRKGSNAI